MAPDTGSFLYRESMNIDHGPNFSIDTFFTGDGFESFAEFRKHVGALSRDQQIYLVIVKVEKYSDCQKNFHGIANVIEEIAQELGIENSIRTSRPEIWSEVADDAKAYRLSRNEQVEALDKIFSIWPRAEVERDIPYLHSLGATTAKNLRCLALAADRMKLTYFQAKKYILVAQYERIRSGGRGISSKREVVASDLRKARADVEASLHPVLTEKELAKIGCGINNRGLICNAKENISHVVIDISAGEPGNGPGDSNVQSSYKPQGRLVDRQVPADGDGLDATLVAFLEHGERDDFERESQSELSDGAIMERKRLRGCNCVSSISARFLRKLSSRERLSHTSKASMIQVWKQNSKGMCYHHSRRAMGKVGLKTNGLSLEMIKQRLNVYHDASLQGKIGALMTGDGTWQWFRRDSRPARPDDQLGVYKFTFTIPQKHGYELSKESQMNTAAYLGIDHAKWERDGSINCPLFSWWFDMKYEKSGGTAQCTTIAEVIRTEFEMYDHHLRQVDGKPNHGWLRTMFHSLGQQVMRQDIVYFMAYCALRPDRATNLISHPHYAKYSKPGNKVAFRHVDINPVSLVDNGRGESQLQGSVSLDDEREDDCTEVVPFMHLHINDWIKSLKDRPGVNMVGPKPAASRAFTNADAEKYGTRWTPVPCKAGDVRITQPQLPHGPKGPAVRIRRTMLPFFVALQDDLEHLELTEAGSFEDLSRAHRDLTSPPYAPSSWHTPHSGVPYAFPAAITLSGLGCLSDALVGRVRHNMPAVGLMKKRLFEGSKEEKDTIIQNWRKRAVAEVVEGFEIVRQLEKEYFGNKSYFNALDRGIDPNIFVADADPDFD